MSAPSGQVHCERHGPQLRAYVCDHLFHESHQGFVASAAQPDNPFPDAWCLACDKVRLAHGGWNETSEKHLKVRVVCGNCYEEIREKNR